MLNWLISVLINLKIYVMNFPSCVAWGYGTRNVILLKQTIQEFLQTEILLIVLQYGIFFQFCFLYWVYSVSF